MIQTTNLNFFFKEVLILLLCILNLFEIIMIPKYLMLTIAIVNILIVLANFIYVRNHLEEKSVGY